MASLSEGYRHNHDAVPAPRLHKPKETDVERYATRKRLAQILNMSGKELDIVLEKFGVEKVVITKDEGPQYNVEGVRAVKFFGQLIDSNGQPTNTALPGIDQETGEVLIGNDTYVYIPKFIQQYLSHFIQSTEERRKLAKECMTRCTVYGKTKHFKGMADIYRKEDVVKVLIDLGMNAQIFGAAPVSAYAKELPMPEPTRAFAGTTQKLEVLRMRAELHQELFSEEDGRHSLK